jgi:protocatechuate 3,4-dioxygenase beta subunit
MKPRGIAAAVAVLVIVVGIGWWWRARRDAEPTGATPATGSGATIASSARSGASATPAAPATLEVRVVDAAGAIAAATVRIEPADGDPVTLTTDARGVATTALPAGSYDISASATGHEPAALPETELAAGQRAQLSVTLVVGGRALTGLVTDVSGGPVSGARVDAAALAGARPGRAIATALTGADGRYALAVREGQHLVAVRSADYAPQSRYVDVGTAGASADFALVPGGVIEGVVLDERTKEPVPRAAVVARRDGRDTMFGEAGAVLATAGGDGRFRLSGLRPGSYELDAKLVAQRTRSSTVVGLGVAEQVPDVTLLVGAGLAVRGKVVDDGGAPVAGAKVRARGDEDSVAVSDAAGAFALEGLAPGKHFLQARGDAHLPGAPMPVALVDKDIDGVVVRVQAGLRVRGHVEPRQVATVELAPQDDRALRMIRDTVTTGADGSFDLGPLPAGKATLTARCATGDQGSLELAIAPGLGEVVVDVRPGASIAGRVIDGDGKPVAGASVMASGGGGDDAMERITLVNGALTSGFQAITSATGAYEIRGLRAGTYRVSALERGRPVRMRKEVAPVSLAGAEHKQGVDLAIDRASGVIKGVVIGSDGKPIADAWVSATLDFAAMLETMRGTSGGRMLTIESTGSGDGATTDLAPVLTDAQGRFTITGLHDARYEVVAEAQAGKLRGKLAKVTPDASVTIKAVGLSTLSGTVTGPNGPARLFTLELEGPTRAARTFTDGKFELGRVDPGSYQVRVESPDGNATAQVTVAPETPATVTLALVANAILVGKLVDPSGAPIADLGVAVVPAGPGDAVRIQLDGPPPTSGPDGSFRVEHEAGPVALVVLNPGGPPTVQRGLTLEAGKTLDVGTVRIGEAAPAPGSGSGSKQRRAPFAPPIAHR